MDKTSPPVVSASAVAEAAAAAAALNADRPDINAKLLESLQHTTDGHLELAEAAGQEALRLARASGIEFWMARALRRLAHIDQLRGDYLSSEARLSEALRLSVKARDDRTACLCHYAYARQLQALGRPLEAESALGEALMYAQRTGDKDYEGMVYLQQAMCKQWLGHLEDQLHYSEAAIELFREAEDKDFLFFTLTLALDAAEHLGKTRQAAALLAEAEGMAAISGYANVMCGTYAEAALRRFSLGDLAAATDYLRRAEALFDEQCDYDTEILLGIGRGKLLDAQGDHEGAASAFRGAKRRAQQYQSRCHIALVRLERVAGQLALGRLEQAQATLIDAELAFEHIGSQVNLGRVYCAWVHYYHTQANPAGARAALNKAETIALRLEPACGVHLSGDLQRARGLLAH